MKEKLTLQETYQDDGESDEVSKDEQPMVIGFPSAVAWLVGMTVIIALLSDYIVDTIEVWWMISLFSLCIVTTIVEQ